ncbi:LysR family transcriptional regulator [Alkalibaculum sp. M08DMB]|uniref:LysR family transcriptional regulator n=1 Tax=Alkalibaculum sporogenes TaxID=2655001 RepID=A0A6A7KCV3_9FIRM|nr:LysR family transcriptional regulator [Alkalibaculum sporogenes]MPW27350.1 LysR family transcriptional regulator [Alkalibaculum sporogenes]
MTPTQIKYFEATYAKGNIAATAKELYVSRPVISRSIKELEEEFGCLLFIRSPKGVEPTREGHILHQLFLELDYSYQTALRKIRDESSKETEQKIRIAITPTNGYEIYESYCREFYQQYPSFKLEIIERPANEILELILNNAVDVAFTPGRLYEFSVLGHMDLFDSIMSIGVSVNNPLASKKTVGILDLLDKPLGILDAPLPGKKRIDTCFTSIGRKPDVVVQTSLQELLYRMTQENYIITILPNNLMKNWNDVAIIPIDFFESYTHKMYWNKAMVHNFAFDIFYEFMKNKCNSIIEK